MIKKWYEVSCDLCGKGLNHYIKEYEEIRKAVRYSIRFCKKHKIVRCEDKD